jgi:hypothetical protein
VESRISKWRAGALFIVLIGGFVVTPAVRAYEVETHMQMSSLAVQTSILGSIIKQYALGITVVNPDALSPGEVVYFGVDYPLTDPNNGALNEDFATTIRLGSNWEDSGDRSGNHFFNPVDNHPLPPVLSTKFNTSPDWALEDQKQFGADQLYSYAHARQYYWTAITSSDPNSRAMNFGNAFRSLGQVIHHLQDMAQPQHSRTEAHCNRFVPCYAPGIFFGYYHPSIYEGFINNCINPQPGADPLSLGGCAPVTGALGLSYTPVFSESDSTVKTEIKNFPSPRSFWVTNASSANGGNPGGFGIAEFTNAGFIGAATNFTGTATAPQPYQPTSLNPEPLPQPDGKGSSVSTVPLTDPSLFGKSAPGSGSMSFLATPVLDPLGTTQTNQRSSTLSMFSAFLAAAGVTQDFSGSFSYNRFNAAAAAAFLIPRAINYSAGLINYFLRGQIGISVPQEGVYGIRDHAVQYGPKGLVTDVDSRTQGFQSIKVKLTNASPDGETMKKGSLRAILRFRRNESFKDDLSEEPGSPGSGSGGVVGLAAVRGSADEYVVSTGVFDPTGTTAVADGTVSLTSTGQEYVFQFQNGVLPLNSTDVYLQIAWQGTLGAEPNAVVTSTIDLGEPLYYPVYNALDYISVGDELYTIAQINANPALVAKIRPTSCVVDGVLKASCYPANGTISLTIAAPGAASTLVTLTNLPAHTYTRVALLTDAFTANSTNYAETPLAIGGFDGGYTEDASALNNEYLVQEPTKGTPAFVLAQSDLYTFRGINNYDGIYYVWDGDGTNSEGDTFFDPKDAVLSGNDIYPVALSGSAGSITFPLH